MVLLPLVIIIMSKKMMKIESTCSNCSLRALLSHLQVGLLHCLPNKKVLTIWNTETQAGDDLSNSTDLRVR